MAKAIGGWCLKAGNSSKGIPNYAESGIGKAAFVAALKALERRHGVRFLGWRDDGPYMWAQCTVGGDVWSISVWYGLDRAVIEEARRGANQMRQAAGILSKKGGE